MKPIHLILRHAQRLEWPILLILLLSAVAIWAFAELADAVMEGGTEKFDRAILLALRSHANPSDPLGPRWLEEMMRDFTALGGVGVLVLLTLAVAGYLLLIGMRRAALDVVLCIVGGILLSSLLKYGFSRPRPDLVPHGARVYTTSFPSGHSMMSALVYLTLGALIARLWPGVRTKVYALTLAVVLTIVVGVSRVYLGVHWPTDVLGGWVTGAAWALLCWALTLWLQTRGQIEPEGGGTER